MNSLFPGVFCVLKSIGPSHMILCFQARKKRDDKVDYEESPTTEKIVYDFALFWLNINHCWLKVDDSKTYLNHLML